MKYAPDMIEAHDWAETLWNAVGPRWTRREGQDRNYRREVTDPAIREITTTLVGDRGVRVLDLGCGDGVLLEGYVGTSLIAGDGAYLGIDQSGTSIAAARSRHEIAGVSFLEGDLCDVDLPGSVAVHGGAWDIVISVFVFQEIPDLAAVLRNAARMTVPGTPCVFIVVEPTFADWLVDSGHMILTEEDAGDQSSEIGHWQWRAPYPIVDEPGDPFFLPYFHRTEEDYAALLAQAGFRVERFVPFPDTEIGLPRLQAEEVSPFVPFPGNLYWPRIAEIPSSLAIIARTE
jgi:SAM-dependent methyltransferase